jgi:hypothetical protein
MTRQSKLALGDPMLEHIRRFFVVFALGVVVFSPGCDQKQTEKGRSEIGNQDADQASQTAEKERIEALRRRAIDEARDNLKTIARGVMSYYHQERYTTAGIPLPQAFPASVGWTPAAPCCGISPDGLCPAVVASWMTEGWKAVKFDVREPHSFRYTIINQDKTPEKAVVVRAMGRPGCVGEAAVLEIYVGLQANNEVYTGPTVLIEGSDQQ